MTVRVPLLTVAISSIAVLLVFACGLYLSPVVMSSFAPRVALAEDMPPQTTSSTTQLQATGTLHSLMVPPAAFYPGQAGMTWSNTGTRLSSTTMGSYIAPVYLPQGARVTRLVVWGEDSLTSTYYVNLYRGQPLTTTVTSMANVAGPNTPGIRKQVDDTIANPAINNGSYEYFLWVFLTSPDVHLDAVKIVYYY